MVAEESKKQKIDENDDSSEHANGELVALIEKLQEAQDELDKLNEEAGEKMLEVKQKYNEIRKPIYIRRNKAIEKVPDFWLTAFQGHPMLCELLTEEDQKVFKYLKSLDVSESEDAKSGYSITFEFNPNPYFENAKLTKVFSFDDEGNTTSTGTNIKWKDGMKISENGSANEKKGNKKKRHLTKESFFTWFGEVNADECYLVHDEVGNIINEDLWVNPLEYFNNDEEDLNEDDDDENGEHTENVEHSDDDDGDDDTDDDCEDDS